MDKVAKVRGENSVGRVGNGGISLLGSALKGKERVTRARGKVQEESGEENKVRVRVRGNGLQMAGSAIITTLSVIQ